MFHYHEGRPSCPSKYSPMSYRFEPLNKGSSEEDSARLPLRSSGRISSDSTSGLPLRVREESLDSHSPQTASRSSCGRRSLNLRAVRERVTLDGSLSKKRTTRSISLIQSTGRRTSFTDSWSSLRLRGKGFFCVLSAPHVALSCASPEGKLSSLDTGRAVVPHIRVR